MCFKDLCWDSDSLRAEGLGFEHQHYARFSTLVQLGFETNILQNGKRVSLPEIKQPGPDTDAPSHTAQMFNIGRSMYVPPLCLQRHVTWLPVPLL
jgi:hypothetical protein